MFKRAKVVMLPTNKRANQGDIMFLKRGSTPLTKQGDLAIAVLAIVNVSKEIEWETQHLYFLSDQKIKEGDWCVVKWGTNVSGEDLFEVTKCTKIGVGGIHYFDSISMCWGEHELQAKKIIVTTDKLPVGSYQGSVEVDGDIIDCNDYLPNPSRAFKEIFVKKFNSKKPITDVMILHDVPERVESTENYDMDDIVFKGEVIETIHRDMPWHPLRHKEYNDVKVDSDNIATIRKMKDNWSYEEVRQIAIKFKAIGGNERDNCWLSTHNEIFDHIIYEEL